MSCRIKNQKENLTVKESAMYLTEKFRNLPPTKGDSSE